MAQYNDLSALFKRIYAPRLGDLVPTSSKFQDLVPFMDNSKVGESYIFPVVLSQEQGVTYNTNATVAATLATAVAAVYKDATLVPGEIIVRSQMTNTQARRAASSEAAFVKAADRLVKSTMASASKRVEIEMLYGTAPTGIGKVSAIASHVITFTAASWAPGIWAGTEGALIEAWTAVGGTQHGDTAGMPITAVDLVNKTITVTGDTTGTAVAANDYIFFAGSQASGIVGLDCFLTFSGSVLGISNSTYALWRGSQLDCGSAALTLAKVEAGAAVAAARGLEDDAVLLVSPATFANMSSDEAALRRYNGDMGSARRGAQSIMFDCANGKVEVIAHKFVKEGDAFMFNPKDLKRIGSTEVSFKDPASGEEAAFFQLENTNGVELRCWSDQGLLVEAPAKCVKFINIVNS